MSGEQEIYFHVGLGKTGSTYLQKKFFPKLTHIEYIPTDQYRKSKKILNIKGAGRYLLSREFDVQLRQQLRWFVSGFPSTKVIVVFRRHDQWLLSQYKRHVKNGWYKSFSDFFSLDEPSMWSKEGLFYSDMIDYIESRTGNRPLVLLYDELEKDPFSFFDKIAVYTGSKFDKEKISLARVHSSYSDKQLSFLQQFTKRFIRTFPNDHTNNKWKHWFIFRPWWILYHLILYFAWLLPESWVPEGDFPSKEDLSGIKTYYSEDWEKVKKIASEQSLLISDKLD